MTDFSSVSRQYSKPCAFTEKNKKQVISRSGVHKILRSRPERRENTYYESTGKIWKRIRGLQAY